MNKTLFFVRKDCKYTKKTIDFLCEQGFKVKVIFSESRSQDHKKKWENWNGDYVFSYRSFYIIPNELLKKVKKAAINFHPGPNNYRGSGGLNFALFNSEKEFGVTAHLINEKIDNGKIIFFKEFLINKDKNVERLLLKTHNQCIKYSQMLIPKIIKDTRFIDILVKKFQMISWSNKIYNKDYLDSFYKISLNKKIHNEFLKKINATYYKEFKPYIIINKKKFFLNEE